MLVSALVDGNKFNVDRANMLQRLDASSKNRIRSFGHIKLCGALHVCWASKNGIDGQYMVCLLYKDVLCIASAGKADQIYTIQAVINMASVKVEEVDDGWGRSLLGGGRLPLGMELIRHSRTAMSHGPVLLETGVRV